MLTKNTSEVLVSPGVPARPAMPSVPFQVFAPPPPKGYKYNAPVPTSVAEMRNWKQLVQSTAASFQYGVYYPMSYFNNAYSFDLSLWQPVYGPPVWDSVQGVYQTPVLGATYIGPDAAEWFDAPAGLTYMYTKGIPTEPNGYPKAVLIAPPPTVAFYFRVGGIEYGANFRLQNNNAYKLDRWLTPLPTNYLLLGGAIGMDSIAGSPAIPGVPAVYHTDRHEGWNAGANSVARLDGDVQTVFSVDVVAACAVGFAPAGAAIAAGSYKDLTHAIYIDRSEGRLSAWIMERGRIIKRQDIAAGDSCTIKRVGGVVTYTIGALPEVTSSQLSGGALMVAAAIYRGGDSVI